MASFSVTVGTTCGWPTVPTPTGWRDTVGAAGSCPLAAVLVSMPRPAMTASREIVLTCTGLLLLVIHGPVGRFPGPPRLDGAVHPGGPLRERFLLRRIEHVPDVPVHQ